MKFLRQIQSSLERINGYRQDLAVEDFVVPSSTTDRFIIREIEGESEVLICLRRALITRLNDKSFPDDFTLDILPDLSVAIEELSHFNTYCFSALRDQEIKPLELEVQGEVDKFAVALEFLHQKNQEDLREKVFDTLFEKCTLGDWVEPEERQRYIEAHEIARNFCRKSLEGGREFSGLREEFRSFFSQSGQKKLGAKY